MTRTKGLVLAFYLAAAAAGIAIGIAIDRYTMHPATSGYSAKAMRDRFANDLQLTASQRATVDSILDARFLAESLLVHPIRPQLDSVRGAARLKISAVLTPEQQRVYEQMQREQKSRVQEKK